MGFCYFYMYTIFRIVIYDAVLTMLILLNIYTILNYYLNLTLRISLYFSLYNSIRDIYR